MTQQSETLTTFYQNYRDWVDQGTPIDCIFVTDYGLCSNLKKFLEAYGVDSAKSFINEMETQFEEAGLDYEFPFDIGGEEDAYYNYVHESPNYHLNEKRMMWVREHCYD